ncbi:MAG TPA: hypothetical protein PKA16_01775 [Ottowia sp.]|uniref:hypothetical protein n=1 Tax=Ottowia sp. TaxID=1898956 RepID=UPI002C5C0358|nr:hypothetical protein [Ottowia sp.]HMN20099.1 hypothetical protein [Ottowia sp.]
MFAKQIVVLSVTRHGPAINLFDYYRDAEHFARCLVSLGWTMGLVDGGYVVVPHESELDLDREAA